MSFDCVLQAFMRCWLGQRFVLHVLCPVSHGCHLSSSTRRQHLALQVEVKPLRWFALNMDAGEAESSRGRVPCVGGCTPDTHDGCWLPSPAALRLGASQLVTCHQVLLAMPL